VPRAAWLAAALALTVAIAGCAMVEGLFFHPDRVEYTRPRQFGLAHEDVFIVTADGSRLHAWWLPAAGPARATVLHLHGNAGNVSNHLPLVAWLPPAGFNVLTLDYRGFGRSEGKPSLEGIVEDAAAALEHLRTRRDGASERLIVLGQSLGGATALRLLARDDAGVRLAIIDSSFASYRGIARDAALQSVMLAPFLPFALPMLPPAERDPGVAAARLTMPVVFVHGSADAVVPYRHSEALHAAAPEPKTLVRVEGAAHMEALTRGDVQARLLAAMRRALP
jgi:hypothetical protein